MDTISDLWKNPLKTRFGVWAYLFCCLAVVSALPVLVLGIIQVPRWETVQLNEVDREGRFVVEALVHGIGQIVEGHVRAVETLARQVQIRQTLDSAVLQEIVTSQRLLYGDFSFMYVAGTDAISIASDPPIKNGKPTAGINYSTRDYYKELVRTQKTAISRVQIGKRSGAPKVQIVAPIWDKNHEMKGFAEGALDLRAIQVMADRLTSATSGLQVAVLDHEGRVIAHPDKEVRNAVKNLSDLRIFQKVKAAETEVQTGMDDKGIMMRASVAGVNQYALDWTVAVYRPAAAVRTQAAAARKNVLTIAGVALLACFGFATLLAGSLARPISELASIATAVGNGNFSQLPSLPYSLVPREVAALQIQLREMVLQLKDYTSKLEQRIDEQTEQLTEANRELDSFVYSVSHDLKVPVISLYGMATMLKKKLGDNLDEKSGHYLERLMANASFMEQLIVDLLNFSRLGKQECNVEKLNVDQVVSNVLVQCDRKIRERNIKIEVSLPLPDVYFDRTRLCKIFLNFIANAIKFMGDQAHPIVEVGGQKGDGVVEFYI